MKEAIACVRFLAIDILALLELAATRKLNELWFVRSTRCYIQTPDLRVKVKPVAIEGNAKLLRDSKSSPRVEILELHNHVLHTLCIQDVDDKENTFVDLCFTDEGEFCLVLCCDTYREITETRPYRWMTDMHNRRSF